MTQFDHMTEVNLNHYTYMVRHNPNCPSPFEVRTCGRAFMVDPKEPRNFVSYGQTMVEAMANAIVKIEDDERGKRVRRAQEPFLRIVWA